MSPTGGNPASPFRRVQRRRRLIDVNDVIRGDRRRSTGIAGLIAAALVSSLTLVGLSGTPAAAAEAAEREILQRVNAARADHGLRPLTMRDSLQSTARNWSEHMASGRCSDGNLICHNHNLAYQVDNWQRLGENVGYAGSAAAVQNAWMDSTYHRANILDAAFTHIGIGTTTDGHGRLFATQIFVTASSIVQEPVPVDFNAKSPDTNRVKMRTDLSPAHQGARVKFYRVKKNGDRIALGSKRADERGNAILKHRFAHASGKSYRFVSVIHPGCDRHKKTRSPRDRVRIK